MCDNGRREDKTEQKRGSEIPGEVGHFEMGVGRIKNVKYLPVESVTDANGGGGMEVNGKVTGVKKAAEKAYGFIVKRKRVE